MRLTYRDSEGRAHWIAELLEDTSGESAEFIRRTVADYEDELEGKQSEKNRIPGRCEDCASCDKEHGLDGGPFEARLLPCKHFSCKDAGMTFYTHPEDFCSWFVLREEEAT